MIFQPSCRSFKDTTYHGYYVSLNRSHQLTGHGLNLAPRIYNKLRKNAHKKNSPESKGTKEKMQLELEPGAPLTEITLLFNFSIHFFQCFRRCI